MQKIDTALNKTLERLSARAKERRENKMVQLPLWPEAKRGTPNSFLRSSIFSAIQSKNRYFTKKEVLYSQEGITVKYTGERLNQEDLTLWETLIHLTGQIPLGNECIFTAHGILKAMRLAIGGDQYERLHDGITRLTGGVVDITHEGKTYFGTLIDGGRKDEVNRVYSLRLNRDLICLYGDTQYTAIDWDQRLELRRQPLTQFLHGYYSSHRHPYPVKIETLRQLSGSQNRHVAGFKRQAKSALDALVAIGFLLSYKIDGNLVSVERNNQSSLQAQK